MRFLISFLFALPFIFAAPTAPTAPTSSNSAPWALSPQNTDTSLTSTSFLSVLPTEIPPPPNPDDDDDDTVYWHQYPCLDISHHFRHQRTWIAVSSKTGCMRLETDNDTIWRLNQLAHNPTNLYQKGMSLLCNAPSGWCSWAWSVISEIRGA